jgi:GAF domain-containing protein/HAMP domain-containing protein
MMNDFASFFKRLISNIRLWLLYRFQKSPLLFRLKLVLFPSVLIALSITVAGVFIFNSLERVVYSLETISNQVLEKEKETEISNILHAIAGQFDRDLSQPLRLAQEISDYLEEVNELVYENYYDRGLSADALEILSEGQYGNSTRDYSSIFIPQSTYLDEPVVRDLNFSKSLEWIAPGIFTRNPGLAVILFGTPRNVLVSYPNLNLSSILPEDYVVTQKAWFRNGFLDISSDELILSLPFQSEFSADKVVTTSFPVRDKNGSILGVIRIDFRFENITKSISQNNNFYPGSYFLMDGEGKVIYFPDTNKEFLYQDPFPNETIFELLMIEDQSTLLIQNMRNKQAGFYSLDTQDRKLWVAYTPLQTVNWSLGYVVEANDIIEPVSFIHQAFQVTSKSLATQRIIPISIVIILLFSTIGILITRNLFDPITKLADAAQHIAARQWRIQIPQNAPGEIGILANAFEKMKVELQTALSSLEEKVDARTRALARRTVQLQTASEVAREVVATRNFDILLNRTVNLLVDRFGFYHVGLFLVDSQRDYAILHAAPGEIGREMLAQGHRLRVGSATIVGHVASVGEPKLLLSVEKDPYHFFNPLLPRTKSEIGLPLVVNQRVIGVLDVQSSEEAAFSQDEIDVLQTLSDQLAIAIDTAKLNLEFNDLKRQFENLQNQISQEIWANVSKSMRIGAYQKDTSGLKMLTHNELKKSDLHAPYSLPIKVRGVTVSYLDIWPAAETLSPDELLFLELLQDRVGQAVESARLFEETQKKATREHAVNEFMLGLSHSLDLENLILTALNQFGKMPGIREVEIIIDPNQSKVNKASWVSDDDGEHE